MTSSNLFSIFEEIENSIMTEIEKQIEEMEKSLKW